MSNNNSIGTPPFSPFGSPLSSPRNNQNGDMNPSSIKSDLMGRRFTIGTGTPPSPRSLLEFEESQEPKTLSPRKYTFEGNNTNTNLNLKSSTSSEFAFTVSSPLSTPRSISTPRSEKPKRKSSRFNKEEKSKEQPNSILIGPSTYSGKAIKDFVSKSISFQYRSDQPQSTGRDRSKSVTDIQPIVDEVPEEQLDITQYHGCPSPTGGHSPAVLRKNGNVNVQRQEKLTLGTKTLTSKQKLQAYLEKHLNLQNLATTDFFAKATHLLPEHKEYVQETKKLIKKDEKNRSREGSPKSLEKGSYFPQNSFNALLQRQLTILHLYLNRCHEIADVVINDAFRKSLPLVSELKKYKGKLNIVAAIEEILKSNLQPLFETQFQQIMSEQAKTTPVAFSYAETLEKVKGLCTFREDKLQINLARFLCESYVSFFEIKNAEKTCVHQSQVTDFDPNDPNSEDCLKTLNKFFELLGQKAYRDDQIFVELNHKLLKLKKDPVFIKNLIDVYLEIASKEEKDSLNKSIRVRKSPEEIKALLQTKAYAEIYEELKKSRPQCPDFYQLIKQWLIAIQISDQEKLGPAIQNVKAAKGYALDEQYLDKHQVDYKGSNDKIRKQDSLGVEHGPGRNAFIEVIFRSNVLEVRYIRKTQLLSDQPGKAVLWQYVKELFEFDKEEPSVEMIFIKDFQKLTVGEKRSADESFMRYYRVAQIYGYPIKEKAEMA